MKVVISKSEDTLLLFLGALGVVILGALVFLVKTERIDPEACGIAMTLMLALMFIGWLVLFFRKRTAEKKCAEEFGRELPKDPVRRAIVGGNINYHLSIDKSEIKKFTAERSALATRLGRKKFLDDAQTEAAFGELDAVDANIKDTTAEFARRHGIARRALGRAGVYVQAE